jgi:hypothetical protein
MQYSRKAAISSMLLGATKFMGVIIPQKTYYGDTDEDDYDDSLAEVFLRGANSCEYESII